MSKGFTILKVRGIPVRVDFTWFISFAVITFILYRSYSSLNPSWGTLQVIFIAAASVLLLFILVLIHELAHSIMAQLRGVRVNDITLFLLGGVSNIRDEVRSSLSEFLITIIGPLTNVILFCAFLGVELSSLTDNSPSINALIEYGTRINVVLAIFNMLPGLPLDGGRVLSSIVWAITRKPEKPYIATAVAGTTGQIFGILFMLVAILPIIGSFTLIPLLNAIGADGLSNFFENLITTTGLDRLSFGTIWFVFIGFFLFTASSAEKRHAKIQQKRNDLWDEWEDQP